MKNTDMWRNRQFCIFLFIICGDAHHFVDVRNLWVVKGIVPVVEGRNKINMLKSTTQLHSMKSLNNFQNALPSDFNFFADYSTDI